MSDVVLDERAKTFLETLASLGVAPLEQLTVAQARDRKFPEIGACEKIASQYDVQIPVRHGTVRARVYVPEVAVSAAETASLPAIIYFHGGGWVLGELDHYNQLCAAMTRRSGCIVISLEYRLAPETPFPGGLEDCLDTVSHLSQLPLTGRYSSGQTWRLDPQQLLLMGDSAGGNLAAAVAQTFLDHEQISILGQVLIYPVTDSRLDRPSYQRFRDGYLLTTAAMQWFWDHYCPREELRSHADASPLQFRQLEKLPPTYLITCQCDPLRDEGNAYGKKLAAAGVDLYHEEIPGMIHGFIRFTHNFPQSQKQISQISQWIRQRVSTPALAGDA